MKKLFIIKAQNTCGGSTVAPLTLWFFFLLAFGLTAVSWSWSGTWAGHHGGKSVRAGETFRLRIVVASYFVWDAVAAFVALSSVPRVAGQLTPRLLFMELQGARHNEGDYR